MVITIDARESGTSTGRYIDKLIENLAKLDTDYKFVILTKSKRIDYIKRIAPSFEVVESNFKEFTFSEQLGFKNQLSNIKPVLVHFGMTQQPVLYKGKSITTIHDLTTARFTNPNKNLLIFKSKQFVYRWVIKRVSKKSDLIITPSEYVKKDLVDFSKINKDKIIVTYEAADKISDPPAPLKNLTSQAFLLYVGRYQPHKNLKRLIEALSLLKESNPSLSLVLAGSQDDAQKSILNYANKLGVEDRIITTGFVTEGELRWLYENSAAYVFPSLSEGFGLPGLEAMAHGTPVISSSSTCLPEIYGDAAHYFDPTSAKDMAAKINEVIVNKALRTSLIEKGKKQVSQYSWEKTAKQTLDAYQKILDKK